MQNRRWLALGCAAAIPASIPAEVASAASFTALKRCYVALPGTQPQTEQVNVAGTGYTPGVGVDIAIDGAPQVTGAPVSAMGRLGADPANPILAPAPFIARGARRFSLVAFQNGQPVANGTSRVAALDVSLSPRRARPSSRIRFSGRGFTGKGNVYAHYRFRGRTRRTVTFHPSGACGTFSAKKRQIPVSNPGTGNWTVQFDQERKYARQPKSVFVRLTIVVTRRIRFSRATAAEATSARVVAAGL